MTKDQCPMTKEVPNPKFQVGHWNLELLWSLRHWTLVICARASALRSRLLSLRLRLLRHQRPLEVGHGLAQPLVVLDQRDAHEVLTVLTERAARSQRDFRLVHHPQA